MSVKKPVKKPSQPSQWGQRMPRDVESLIAFGEELLSKHGEQNPRVWVQYHRGSIVLGAWARIFARRNKFVAELEAWADTPEGAKRTFAEIVKRHADRYTASR